MARDILAAATETLAAKGPSVQLVASAEFSLIADAATERAIPVVDTLDVLVDTIGAFAVGNTDPGTTQRLRAAATKRMGAWKR